MNKDKNFLSALDDWGSVLTDTFESNFTSNDLILYPINCYKWEHRISFDGDICNFEFYSDQQMQHNPENKIDKITLTNVLDDPTIKVYKNNNIKYISINAPVRKLLINGVSYIEPILNSIDEETIDKINKCSELKFYCLSVEISSFFNNGEEPLFNCVSKIFDQFEMINISMTDDLKKPLLVDYWYMSSITEYGDIDTEFEATVDKRTRNKLYNL